MIRRAMLQALDQLSQILEAFQTLPPEQADALYRDSGAGRHLRHAFDHYHALRDGIGSGLVDYNQRRRDSAEERCRLAARQQIEALTLWLLAQDMANLSLRMVSEIDCSETETMRFDSNLHRELHYVLNHSIHHAAHIRLALLQRGLLLPEHIGIAPCTATWQRQQRVIDSACAH